MLYPAKSTVESISAAHLKHPSFDSNAERDFYFRHPELQHVGDTFYRTTVGNTDIDFVDSDNCHFRARPDFLSPSEVFIEFKDYKLNYQQTKYIADNKLLKERANPFNDRKSDHFLQLKYGWNHSLEKQVIVQQTLKLQNKRMVVVFSIEATKEKLFNAFIKKAEKRGLDYCIEDDEKFNALFLLNDPETLH